MEVVPLRFTPQVQNMDRKTAMILTELRDALAKATGPDRKLDTAIAIGVLGYEWYQKEYGLLVRRGGAGYDTHDYDLPAYTASLDAAVTLVPEGAWKEVSGPRRYLNIPSPVPNYWHTEITTWNPMKMAHGWGATEPLSICVARLNLELAKASESRSDARDGGVVSAASEHANKREESI